MIHNNMQIQVKVEEQKFKLSIGKGFNDWAWLAHYASRVYSKTIYPQGTYIPALLYIQTKNGEFHPHPRQKIKFYLEAYHMNIEDLTAIIKIRKSNHIFTDYEKKWENQAFGQDRYFSEIKYSYKMTITNRKKDYYFKLKVYFTISEEIRGLVDPKRIHNYYQLKLDERQIGASDSFFEGNLKLPYGSTSHKLFYYEMEQNGEYGEHELQKIRPEDFKIIVQPLYVSQSTINQLVQQDMKISESINKNLQEKQLEAKKRNTNSSLCCYTFEQLWNIIEELYSKELFLQQYQQSTKQRIKISLEKSINELYQIFFYYFIVQNQQRDKKQDLSITYQHVLHFLRDYQIFPEMKDLLNFLQFYNSDYKFKNIEDTLDVINFGIKFPQFISIILRSIQFLQTSTFMMKGQTFDSAVAKIIQKIIEIESEQDQFTQFRRNIRQNAKIISLIRSYSQQIKKIFCNQARSSIQNSASEYCLKKQQIKRMLQMAAITQKNTDLIIEQCFNELKLREEGVFYYQFLNILQWLSIATISSDKEDQDIENDEEESALIVEKIKYLIDKIVVLI